MYITIGEFQVFIQILIDFIVIFEEQGVMFVGIVLLKYGRMIIIWIQELIDNFVIKLFMAVVLDKDLLFLIKHGKLDILTT